MGTKSEYIREETEICLSVLLELMTILGEYRDNIAIIGGWVPYLLMNHVRHEHIGSLDIDIVLDFTKITDENYRTILELLREHGYAQKAENIPFAFVKEVMSTSEIKYKVQVDLMAGEYEGTGKSHRHQNIQDIKARKARGADLVFSHYTSVKISGKMPDGSENKITVKVAGLIPFLVMKGMALWERKSEKDAYDIYFVIKNYPDGLGALVEEFRPHIDNKIIREGLGKIKAKFESLDMIGPKWIVNFEEIEDDEEKDMLRRDSFERVNAFLDELNIQPYSE